MNASRTLLLLATLTFAATGAFIRAEESGEQSPVGDLQIRSAPEGTDITLEVPKELREEDRTERRPGLSAGGVAALVATPEPTPTFEPTETPTPEPEETARARESE